MAKPPPGGIKFKPTGVTGKKTTTPTTAAAKKKLQTDMLKKKAESLKPLTNKTTTSRSTTKKTSVMGGYKSPAMKKMNEKMEPAKKKAMERKMGRSS